MKSWHPLSKLVVLGGVVAIGWALLTSDEPKQAVAVAASPERKLPAAPGRLADVPELPAAIDTRFHLPPIESFGAMIERPLFSPSRRQQEPVIVAVEPSSVAVEPEAGPIGPPDPSIAFVGSLKRGNEVLALITRGKGDVVQAVRRGEHIDGWEVMGVDDRSLMLGYDGERIQLDLFN